MLRWRADQDKFVLLSNFAKRGWVRGSEDGTDWNVFFASPNSTKLLFSSLPSPLLPSHLPLLLLLLMLPHSIRLHALRPTGSERAARWTTDAIHVLAVFVLAQAAHCLRVSAGFRRVAAAYGDASALLKKPKMLIPALPFAPFLMSLQTKMCSFSRSVQRYPCLSVPHSAPSCPHFSRF